MSEPRVRVIDQNGTTVFKVVKDQKLNVVIDVDGIVDTDNPPEPIEVTLTTARGTTRTLTVPWNGDHRLPDQDYVVDPFDPAVPAPHPAVVTYRSFPFDIEHGGGDGATTVDVAGFSARFGGFRGISLQEDQGITLSIEGNHDAAKISVFRSSLTFNLDAIRHAIGEAKKALVDAYPGLLESKESLEQIDDVTLTGKGRERKSRMLQEIGRRIDLLSLQVTYLDKGIHALNNPKRDESVNAVFARRYLQIAFDPDPETANSDTNWTATRRRAKADAEDQLWLGIGKALGGAYRLIVQETGMAQLHTILTGHDEAGKKVPWWGRVTAVLDLVSMGMLMGAGMKFQLDNAVRGRSPDAQPQLDPPKRPKATDPKATASGDIVDTAAMGMPEGAARAFKLSARKYDVTIEARPTNPAAYQRLKDGTALPKSMEMKPKSLTDVDMLLGADAGNQGLIGLYEPKAGFFEGAMRNSGMSDADAARTLDAIKMLDKDAPIPLPPPGFTDKGLWNTVVKRYRQRMNEWTGPIAKEVKTNPNLQVKDGLVIDKKTGKPFTGDHDLFEIRDRNGKPVSKALYDQIVFELMSNAYKAATGEPLPANVMHGAHARWDPQRSQFPPGPAGDKKFAAMRNIYEVIINSHQPRVKRVGTKSGTAELGVAEPVYGGGEILIQFPPEGPPRAIFSGEAAGRTFRHFSTIDSTPPVSGSKMRVPSALLVHVPLGTMQQKPIEWSQGLRDWAQDMVDFEKAVAQVASDAAPMADAVVGTTSEIAESKPDAAAGDTLDVAVPGRPTWLIPALAGGGALVLVAVLFMTLSGGGNEQGAAALPVAPSAASPPATAPVVETAETNRAVATRTTSRPIRATRTTSRLTRAAMRTTK